MVPDAIALKTELNSVSYVFNDAGSASLQALPLGLFVLTLGGAIGCLAAVSFGVLAGILTFLAVAGVGALKYRSSETVGRNQIQVEPSGLLLDMDTGGRITRVAFEEITKLEIFTFEGGECDLCIERFDADGVMLGVSLQAADVVWLHGRLKAHWHEWCERAASEGHKIGEAVQPPAELKALQSLVDDSTTKQH